MLNRSYDIFFFLTCLTRRQNNLIWPKPSLKSWILLEATWVAMSSLDLHLSGCKRFSLIREGIQLTLVSVSTEMSLEGHEICKELFLYCVGSTGWGLSLRCNTLTVDFFPNFSAFWCALPSLAQLQTDSNAFRNVLKEGKKYF